MRAFTPRATSASPDVATRARHARSRAPRIAPKFSAHIPPRRISRAHRPRRADHPSRARARYDARDARWRANRIVDARARARRRCRAGDATTPTTHCHVRIDTYLASNASNATSSSSSSSSSAHRLSEEPRVKARRANARARVFVFWGVRVCACATTTRRGDWKIQKKTPMQQRWIEPRTRRVVVSRDRTTHASSQAFMN